MLSFHELLLVSNNKYGPTILTDWSGLLQRRYTKNKTAHGQKSCIQGFQSTQYRNKSNAVVEKSSDKTKKSTASTTTANQHVSSIPSAISPYLINKPSISSDDLIAGPSNKNYQSFQSTQYKNKANELVEKSSDKTKNRTASTTTANRHVSPSPSAISPYLMNNKPFIPSDALIAGPSNKNYQGLQSTQYKNKANELVEKSPDKTKNPTASATTANSHISRTPSAISPYLINNKPSISSDALIAGPSNKKDQGFQSKQRPHLAYKPNAVVEKSSEKPFASTTTANNDVSPTPAISSHLIDNKPSLLSDCMVAGPPNINNQMPSVSKEGPVFDSPNTHNIQRPLQLTSYSAIMRSESARLTTYTNWPVTFLQPQAMAKAGFYYTQKRDIVRCPFCDIEVMSWEEGDDPMVDHRKWQPSCKFVCNITGHGNIPLSSDESVSSISPDDSGYDTCGTHDIRGMDRVVNSKCVEQMPAGYIKTKPPSFPQYASLETRQQSFASWPVSLKIKPQILSEAGFYYTGKGDQTICYYCGGGLKDWEDTDDPWTEHAKWFSQCTFVILNKGEEFVNNARQSIPKPISSQDATNSLKQEKEKSMNDVQAGKEMPASSSNGNSDACSNDAVLCKLCFSKGLELVFLPCGHLMACVDCGLKLSRCGVCRQEIKGAVRTYLP